MSANEAASSLAQPLYSMVLKYSVLCREELDKLGPLSTDEKLTAGALLITVGLWVFGGSLGIGAVAAALLGLAIMLITNVVTWKECLSNNAAWDTLTWFAALIGMASYLNKYGFIKWFSDQVILSYQPAGGRQRCDHRRRHGSRRPAQRRSQQIVHSPGDQQHGRLEV